MYNNIKNFVKPQYAALFMVCIGCLLLLIFTKSRIEGIVFDRDFRDLKKDVKDQDGDIKGLKKDVKDQAGDIKELKTNDTAQTTGFGTEISKLNTNYDNLNRKFETVNGSLTGLAKKVETTSTQSVANASANTSEITAANKKAIDDFNSTVSLNMKEFDSKKTGLVAEIDSKNADLLANLDSKLSSKNASLLQNLDEKQSEIMKNLDTKQKEISDNLYNQSTMHKNGLQNDAKAFKSVANETTASIVAAKGETIDASQNAKESADSAEDVYKNVFGKSTFDSVKIATQQPTATQQPSVTQQAFTTMFSGSNFVPNTGYYETFVQRERFVTTTPEFQPNPVSPSFIRLENNILNAANTFNAEYAKYILAPSVKDTAALTTAANNLNAALVALTNAYPTTGTTDTVAKSNHATIIAKSKEIDTLRRDLDAKMENILKGKAPQNDFTNEYDSTVYTGVLWSILGSSLLYYIFTEL